MLENVSMNIEKMRDISLRKKFRDFILCAILSCMCLDNTNYDTELESVDKYYKASQKILAKNER